jgi:glycosyltransferase involved in cell wall biosynthesis
MTVALDPTLRAASPNRLRSLRLAHVTATFPPYHGGTGNVAYHNALELARRGHLVRVVTPGKRQGKQADPPGVAVQRLRPALKLGNAPLAPALTQALAGCDLVHLHYPFYFGAEQVWWSCRRTPYVVTYHQDVLFSGSISVAAALHHAVVGRRVLADARLVAATTLDYAAHSRLAGLPRQRLVELPNGVDIDQFWPALPTPELRARYGLAEKAPILLFVGGLDRAHYFKGLPVLLQALRDVERGILLVVGEGDLRAAFEGQARQAGLGQRVRFLGRVEQAELPAHYALADLTVLPSTTMGEAFGLVLLESMACATPVVASRLPGMRVVVQDGVDGRLAAPGDAADLARQINHLLGDEPRRRAMGQAGRRKVEQHYAWPRIGDRLEAFYEAALHGLPPQGGGRP